MSVVPVLRPADYESRLQRYLFERAEEGRAVRVGEKEVSERAEIVARYAELFTRDQLEALRQAESEAGPGDERERLYRLRKTCEAGLISAELAEREDALENAILAARVEFKRDEMPLRTAQATLAVLSDYGERDELGRLATDVSATFNDERLEVLRAGEELEAEVSGVADAVERNEEEKGISIRELEVALARASEAAAEVYTQLKDRWLERLLGPEREEVPSSSHVAYLRRLSPLEAIYTKEQAVQTCMDTLSRLGFDLENEPNIKLDLDDRPQKSPRACVIPADPPTVVHLITRAQGGLHDYQAFLHEAGHALHYAGCDPALPYTFRNISRDHALTEIYSYIVEAISRQPGWHARYFDLTDQEAEQNAEATVFMEALLFRRYAAKLRFELDFWSRFPEDGGTDGGYAELLTAATGMEYRREGFLADMDAGFYSADYLRAWIRAAQLRTYLEREVGGEWWASRETGDRLRELFREGTKPSSEEIAGRIGFEPLDTGPLLAELGAA
ncbi:MAG TPA: hypothetical protein VJ419_03035 [Gaiellaceae bacterium]|jgi:hypothetical protein|nr:hypothetical protein [Gaiellaceae bacterium]